MLGYLRRKVVGIAITIVLFLVQVRNVPVIDQCVSMEELLSRKTRNIPVQAILRKRDRNTLLYGLGGIIFFKRVALYTDQEEN